MQFRLNSRVEVPLRDQLVTQIILAIASGELQPGARLPSTRELARRYRIHQNTVSAAYQRLVRDRWAESRRGSGVYISRNQPDNVPRALPLADQLIIELLRKARMLGIPVSMLDEKWQRWLSRFAPTRFLVVEPDPNLRRIIVHEIAAALTTEVGHCSPDESDILSLASDALVLAMPSKVKQIRSKLEPGIECVALQIQSVNRLASMYSLVPQDWLVAVVSGWDGFLTIARSMLAACGCNPDIVMFRNSHETNWQIGLTQAQVIICDSSVRELVPPARYVIAYQLLSEECVAELKVYQRFFAVRTQKPIL
jgi:DNA-binding transcriptional regulator YhcF (GntR family)